MVGALLSFNRSYHGILRSRHWKVPHGSLRSRQQAISSLVHRKARLPLRNLKSLKHGSGPPPKPTVQAQPPREPEPAVAPSQAGDAAKQEEPVITWYQQLYPWSKTRKLADPDSPDPTDDTGIVKKIKQEIDRLDEELREMEKHPFEPYLKRLPPEERITVEEQVAKLEVEEQKTEKEIQEYLPKMEIKWALPIEQRSHLKELNDNIKESLLTYKDYAVRRKLWRSYARCKSFLPPFLHLVPNEAWMALCRAQTEASHRDDPHWASHLIILVEDMRAAGKNLNPGQLVEYIEALRFEDLLDDAVKEWEALSQYFAIDTRHLAEYELLGVRLFTSQGDLATAERIADKYLNSGDGSESRILIPIMDTWIERGDTIGMKHAWALYLTIKMQLGSNITMDDYDNISNRFLNAGRTDLALAVFKDMMLAGLDSKHDSVALYRRHTQNMDRLTNATSKIPEINELYLTSLAVVPESFQNKYFYSMWMKKLIGEGGADAAAAVLELMFERNVRPDAMHVNGILGAWFRSFTDDNKARAEQIAWSMVFKRLHFVRKRNPEVSDRIRSFLSKMQAESFGTEISAGQNRCIPLATVETYALLLQFYARRTRVADIETLHEAFELGQIQPNAYWTNHLLWMLLHQNRLGDVWKLFLARFDQVSRPDLDTFDCLWQSEERHLRQSNLQSQSEQEFPSPRQLLGYMLNVRYRESMPQEIAETIARCFVRSQDLAGTIVVLHVLKERFGLYPRSKSVHNIIKLVAEHIMKSFEASTPESNVYRSRRLYRDKAKSSAMEILNHVRAARTERLVAAGFDDVNELENNIQQRERLEVVVDFLKHLMQNNLGIRKVDRCIGEAASEMGVGDIDLRDYLRSEYRV